MRPGHAVPARPGVTLPELILSAWLFALVLMALGRFAGAQGRLAARGQDEVRAAELGRAVALVLDRELRHAAPADLRPGRDSIRLRAFRGAGVVCGAAGPRLDLRYRGVRQPDAGKDSVLLITRAAPEGSLHAVMAVAPADSCSGLRVTLDPAPVAPGGLALVFETGSYHLSGGALRYRRGRGGRQPVTEALLADGSFELAGAVVTARMSLDTDSLPRLIAPRRDVRMPLLNRLDLPSVPGPW